MSEKTTANLFVGIADLCFRKFRLRPRSRLGKPRLGLLWCRVCMLARMMPIRETVFWETPRWQVAWTVGRLRREMVCFYLFSSHLCLESLTSCTGLAAVNSFTTALNLTGTHKERAMQVYRLAANINFIQGRQTRHVAAVCLYIACRKDPESRVMLIDFSDLLSVCGFFLCSLNHAHESLDKCLQTWSDLQYSRPGAWSTYRWRVDLRYKPRESYPPFCSGS